MKSKTVLIRPPMMLNLMPLKRNVSLYQPILLMTGQVSDGPKAFTHLVENQFHQRM
jgi:hypothetical protein